METLTLFDLEHPAYPRRMSIPSGPVAYMEISSDGAKVVTFGGGNARLIDIAIQDRLRGVETTNGFANGSDWFRVAGISH